MKQLRLIFVAIAMAVVASFNCAADDDIQDYSFLDSCVDGINMACKDISVATEGVIGRGTCSRSGSDIITNLYFVDPNIKFSYFSQQYIDVLKDDIANSFMQGILEADPYDNIREALKIVRARFIFNIYDIDGQYFTKIIDFTQM